VNENQEQGQTMRIVKVERVNDFEFLEDRHDYRADVNVKVVNKVFEVALEYSVNYSKPEAKRVARVTGEVALREDFLELGIILDFDELLAEYKEQAQKKVDAKRAQDMKKAAMEYDKSWAHGFIATAKKLAPEFKWNISMDKETYVAMDFHHWNGDLKVSCKVGGYHNTVELYDGYLRTNDQDWKTRTARKFETIIRIIKEALHAKIAKEESARLSAQGIAERLNALKNLFPEEKIETSYPEGFKVAVSKYYYITFKFHLAGQWNSKADFFDVQNVGHNLTTEEFKTILSIAKASESGRKV